jgi:hypothetical protein
MYGVIVINFLGAFCCPARQERNGKMAKTLQPSGMCAAATQPPNPRAAEKV